MECSTTMQMRQGGNVLVCAALVFPTEKSDSSMRDLWGYFLGVSSQNKEISFQFSVFLNLKNIVISQCAVVVEATIQPSHGPQQERILLLGRERKLTSGDILVVFPLPLSLKVF